MLIAESTSRTTASADAVWRHWSDPPTWATWDPDVSHVEFEGEFVPGAKGRLTPAVGPVSRWRLVIVEPGSRFVTTSRLLGATVVFDHLIEGDADALAITHRITMTGMTAPVLGRLVGSRLAPGLPIAVRQLAAAAESVVGK